MTSRKAAQQRLLKAVTMCLVLRKMGAIEGFGDASLIYANERLDAPIRVLSATSRIYENIAQGGEGVHELGQLGKLIDDYWHQSWRKKVTTCQKRKKQTRKTPKRAVVTS